MDENDLIEENIRVFNQLVYQMKLILGYKIYENIINQIYQIKFTDLKYDIKIDYFIKDLNKQNMLVEIKYNIREDNVSIEKDNIVEFTLYMLKSKILFEFIKSLELININVNFLRDLIRIFSNVEIKSLIDYRYFMTLNIDIYEESMIELANDSNKRNKELNLRFDSNLILYDQKIYDDDKKQLMKEHSLQLYLKESLIIIFKDNKEIVDSFNLNILNVISLLYYQLIEFLYPFQYYGRQSSREIYNHELLLLQYRKITTPFLNLIEFKHPNIKIGNERSISLAKSERYVWNGRLFFNYYGSIHLIEIFNNMRSLGNDRNKIVSHLTQLNAHNNSGFYYIKKEIDKISDKTKKDELSLMISSLKNKIGVRISQFAIGEITIYDNEDNLTLTLDARIRSHDLNIITDTHKFVENEENSSYSTILFHKKIKVLDILKPEVVGFIQEIHNYLKEIFYVYPQHSKLIGNSDILYYFKLYDHFPTLRKFELPLTINTEFLIDTSLDIIIDFLNEWNSRKYDLIEYSLKFKNNKFELIKESRILHEYLIVMREFHKNIGMGFGSLYIDSTMNNTLRFAQADPRMQRYNTENWENKKMQLIEIKSHLNSYLNWCFEHQFFFEMNYIIENMIKMVDNTFTIDDILASIVLELQDEVLHRFEFKDNSSIEREAFMIVYPYTAQKIPNEFISDTKFFIKHAGINLLLVSRKENVIVLKLNESKFSDDEINFIETITLKKVVRLNEQKGWTLYNSLYFPSSIYQFGILIESINLKQAYNYLSESETIEYFNKAYKSLFDYEYDEFFNTDKYLENNVKKAILEANFQN